MKKIITSLLALSLVFALVGCSSASSTTQVNGAGSSDTENDHALSYEEMLENAEKVALTDIYADADENALRAAETYVGNTYRVSAYVTEIERGFFRTIQYLDYGGYRSVVNLANEEDLLTISTSNTYEFVGVISSVENGKIVFDNAYLIDVDNYDFTLDGMYYSETGILDPSNYNLTVEEYMARNPQKLEENLSDDDDIDLFVFATLHASDADGAELYLPKKADNGEISLELTVGDHTSRTVFYMNDYENRMSKFFEGYKDGYYRTGSDKSLEAGSGDSVELAGLFYVEYGVYKEAVENNAEVTLDWGGRYTITANAQDIIKMDSVSAIAGALENEMC